jgi:hypothetical protein
VGGLNTGGRAVVSTQSRRADFLRLYSVPLQQAWSVLAMARVKDEAPDALFSHRTYYCVPVLALTLPRFDGHGSGEPGHDQDVLQSRSGPRLRLAGTSPRAWCGFPGRWRPGLRCGRPRRPRSGRAARRWPAAPRCYRGPVTAISSQSTCAPHRAWSPDVVEGFIARPGVVDDDPGEGQQDPGGLHPILAALGVHGRTAPARSRRPGPALSSRSRTRT